MARLRQLLNQRLRARGGPEALLSEHSVFDHPTLTALARHIHGRLHAPRPPRAPPAAHAAPIAADEAAAAEAEPAASAAAAAAREPSAEPAAAAAALAEYQMWPHGFVAVATLRASRRALALLAVPHTLPALAAATGANGGQLHVALRTLRALGWVTLSEDGEYAAPASTRAAAGCAALGELCDAVYSDAPGTVARLAAQLTNADEGWAGFAADGAAPANLRTMLTGAVLVPLLMELRGHLVERKPAAACHGGGVRLVEVERAAAGQLLASFCKRGLCDAALSADGAADPNPDPNPSASPNLGPKPNPKPHP